MDTQIATQNNTTPALPEQKFSLLPKGLTPTYVANDDEQDDLAGVNGRNPILRASGKLGRFVLVGSDPPVEQSKVEGLALAKINGQMLFPAKANSPHEAQLGGKLFESHEKWICKNSNTLKSQPRLHPELTEEQRSRALQLGAGKSCATCPLGKWNNATRTKPACNAQINLLWLDKEMGEPLLLQIGSATSVPAVMAFLGAKFKKNGTGIALYSYTTKLEMEHVKDGAKDFYRVKPSIGEQTPEDQMDTLRQLRASLVADLEALIEEASEISIEAEDHQEGGEAAPAQTAASAPAPPAQETFFDNDLGLPAEEATGPKVHVPF